MVNPKKEIIAVPSESNGGLSDNFSQVFGRCKTFTFVTIENNEISEVKTVHNPGPDEMGGAGIVASQVVGNHNANTVLCGSLGGNAFSALTQLKIDLYTVPNKKLTIKETIEFYQKGNLKKLTNANVAPHQGMGGGMGQGLGRGAGAGGGRGRRG